MTAMTDKEKRVNIQLPEELHTKAKILSVLQGTTLNEYLVAAIQEKTSREEKHFSKLKRYEK